MCSAIAPASAGVGEYPRRAAIAFGTTASACAWMLETQRTHAGVGRPAAEDLGDERAQVAEARPHALLDQPVEGRRGVAHLALDEAVDGARPPRQEAAHERRDEDAQPAPPGASPSPARRAASVVPRIASIALCTTSW